MLSLHRVRKRFPEVRTSPGEDGSIQYNVHCTQPHAKGGRYKLTINSETGCFYCNDCGYTGFADKVWFDAIEDQFEHLAIQRDAELSTILEARARPRDGVFVKKGGQVWENNVPSPGKLVPFASLADDHPAVEYLADRGYDIEEIRNFEPNMALYYCTRGIPFRCGTTTGRIVFPFYMDGVLKGWQARKIEKTIEPGKLKQVWDGENWRDVTWNTRRKGWDDKDIPKYLTCPGMTAGDVLFGYDQARKNKTSDHKVIVVVEGPLDQMKVGYPCVATLGSLKPHQIRLLLTYWDTAVIIRDPGIDPQSRQFQEALANLSAIKTCHFALPNNLDPGGTEREVIWNEIAKEMNRRNYELPLHCQRN